MGKRKKTSLQQSILAALDKHKQKTEIRSLYKSTLKNNEQYIGLNIGLVTRRQLGQSSRYRQWLLVQDSNSPGNKSKT